MGRHADPSAARRRLPEMSPAVLVAGAVVLVLIAGGLIWWGVSSGSSSDGPCAEPQTVRVVVVPELSALVRDQLADPVQLDADACAVAEVRTQDPLETVANLRALDESALPELWVADSSLWGLRAPDAGLDPAGSLASSPVVVAAGPEVAEELGWTDQPPAWRDLLAVDRPLAVPDLSANIEPQLAMASVHASLGGDADADNAVVQMALAAARGPVLQPSQAIEAVAAGGSDAPIGVLSEQEVLATNRAAGGTQLVAVYPADGSPRLDYPVLRVGQNPEALQTAVDAVAAVLTSDQVRAAAQELGFRGPDGAAPSGDLAGVQEAAPQELALDRTAVQGLLSRLASLTTPPRLLTVMDISTSMEAPVGNGTRATLARDATKSALALLPDSAAAGLWVFASTLEGGDDWQELVPLRPLSADADGLPQRQVLASQLDTIPDRLVRGGTSLYDTTLAAVRSVQENYDPNFVNSVVIITDGQNEDDEGIQLPELLQTLQSEADPDRPIKVFGIALGEDADLQALEQIAEVTGGGAFSAEDPRDLQSVLFTALAQRGQ